MAAKLEAARRRQKAAETDAARAAEAAAAEAARREALRSAEAETVGPGR